RVLQEWYSVGEAVEQNQHRGQVVSRGERVGMIGGQNPTADRQDRLQDIFGPLSQILTTFLITNHEEILPEIVLHFERFRVFRAEGVPVCLVRLFEEVQRGRGVAVLVQQLGQVVHGRQRVDVLRAQ